MKLDNIKVGMVIKNYKELCKVLEIEPASGGNAKKKQIEWIEEYINYEKDGYSFIINEVSDEEVKPMSDGRSEVIPYMEILEKLILDLMVQEGNNETLFLSKTQILTQLKMINGNYMTGKMKVGRLSEFMEVDEITAQDWYNSTGTMLERNVVSALDSLQKQSLVFWNKVITVDVDTVVRSAVQKSDEVGYNSKGEEIDIYERVDITEREHREATKEEVKIILSVEREAMLKLGSRNKAEVINKGRWEEFSEQVALQVKERANINYYYKSYSVVFNDEDIQDQADVLKRNLLSWIDRDEKQKELNQGLQDRTIANAQNRHVSSSNHFGVSNKDYRSSKKYVTDSAKLSEVLLSLEAENIRQYLNKKQ